MLWHLLRYLLTFSIPAFYRKIQAKNAHFVHQKGPVIIAMNHPNAFMDPICFTWVTYPLKSHYMARGDAFKPGLASFLLRSIGIIPIFRLRDGGKDGLIKNDESYDTVNQLLSKNKKVIIFAEGLCIQERRLRPLKKGVARMVFGAYNHLSDKNLLVIPVGINYSKPDKFRSKIFYNIGEPIKVSDWEIHYRENPAKAYNIFLKDLYTKMHKLVTHINNPDNDELVPYLEEMLMKDYLSNMGLKEGSLEDEFLVTREITETVNKIDVESPQKVVELRTKTQAYFKDLRTAGIRDWLLNPRYGKNKFLLFLRYFLILLILPFFVAGYLSCILPYRLTVKITRKLIKNTMEFYASMAVGIGTFLFLFNFIFYYFVFYLITLSKAWAMAGVLFLLISAWIAKDFYFFIKKTEGMRRVLFNDELRDKMMFRRKEIVDFYFELTKVKE